MLVTDKLRKVHFTMNIISYTFYLDPFYYSPKWSNWISLGKELLKSLFNAHIYITHHNSELRTQNSEYLFAALIHHSILQRTTDTTCGPRATCGNH